MNDLPKLDGSQTPELQKTEVAKLDRSAGNGVTAEMEHDIKSVINYTYNQNYISEKIKQHEEKLKEMWEKNKSKSPLNLTTSLWNDFIWN